MRLKDKVALVTGAGRGIGREIAFTLAKEGARVAVNDINREMAEKTAEDIGKEGYDAIGIKADITDLDEVQKMVDEIREKFGAVDILVNNAGYWTIKQFKDTTPEDWNKDIGICFIGTMNCCKAVLEDMMARKYGRIINIASDAGRVGEPFLSVYSGAKAAVIGFAKALAKEVARYNITVNNVAAGVTKTPGVEGFVSMIGEDKLVKAYPMRRLADPKDIANAVLFFALDESGYITGQTLSVSGGYTTI